MINKKIYNTIALGGTFDHLHDGHKDFLRFASEIGRFLIIGITDKQMTLKKPHANLIQPEYVRKQAVLNFCNQNKIPVKIITLHDPFGPTIEDNTIEAVICTTETLIGANKINEIRQKLGFKQLPIHVHKLKKDSLGIDSISAERIRNGEISRKGTVYHAILINDLHLSEKQRKFFSQLHGKITELPRTEMNNDNKNTTKETVKVVVGDSVLEKFITNKWQYDLGIYDNKRQRKEYHSSVLSSVTNSSQTENQPGWLNTSAVTSLQKWMGNNNYKHLFVNGEEDLLAVAAVLLLPLGSLVYYGQPTVGMVECEVTEDLKEKFFEVLNDIKP